MHNMKAYEELAEFIASRIPREIAEFKPSEETRRRVAELLHKEKTAGLSAEEKSELDGFEEVERLMGLARARARQMLADG
jgi:hypothetical protein